jgi:hypothetical protein
MGFTNVHVKDRIRTAKATGLRNLPLFDFDANDAWGTLAMIAQTLGCWAQALLLDDHDLKVAEPKTRATACGMSPAGSSTTPGA